MYLNDVFRSDSFLQMEGYEGDERRRKTIDEDWNPHDDSPSPSGFPERDWIPVSDTGLIGNQGKQKTNSTQVSQVFFLDIFLQIQPKIYCLLSRLIQPIFRQKMGRKNKNHQKAHLDPNMIDSKISNNLVHNALKASRLDIEG